MVECHRRIERFLNALRRVVERCAGGGLDDEARFTLETSLNYFDRAVPRHTADEEQSLFPRLRRSGAPGAREAMTSLDRLEAEHRLAKAAHLRIDELGRRWLEARGLDESDVVELQTRLDALAAAYARHISVEDEHVFVLALRILTAEGIREIGEEIARRRFEDPGREGSRCARRRQQWHRGV
jgi:hemerythrin-like domain-containing protein